MKELKNLKKIVEELNAPTVYEDGFTCESVFDFKIREGEYGWQIYDSNEQYNIDYLEELNANLYDCAMEFGFPYKPAKEDDIYNELLAAVQKDFGKDYYLEWEDSVVMNITH